MICVYVTRSLSIWRAYARQFCRSGTTVQIRNFVFDS